MNNLGFYKITLPIEKNVFEELSNSVNFETITKGRIGNNLVNILDNQNIPIVRTTSIYNIPPHNFSNEHHQIIASLNIAIQNQSIENLQLVDFNNALIEIYDCNYSKMNYHSDQSLDLEAGSFIGLFSCYENPDKLIEKNIRKLKIKDKVNNEEFEISLTHNSIVLFSLATNEKFLHKIILESTLSKKKFESDNKWLGITFRKSKTFVHFKDNLPYLSDGELLTLADENQKKEFYTLRGQENNNLNFVYPILPYTLSTSDTMKPIGL
ncbi:alpha-ketoglutarate-dependent dioxygenase AlkB [Flavobacterium hydatis]|uniref:Alpha-ketoglutarate-dependent dioxygenase AlkB-like domain-containing protein n=1 Tax=Flavobacterium hydatis TaxID=991 RepID=A0A085ZTX2_FLAHY|nr:alpha-ketoglutarate-dependent dioxygenase AlkB [Flavobacterium hydatis]KFF07886.1 hypothetical protein IW20_23925 [Flavobacterium hydatis]OXA94199.1 hypothetical protein B0A62_11110 [Flavobacterium hydatis]